MTEIQTFTPADFAAAFGAGPADLAALSASAAPYDFRYRRLSQADRDALILSVLTALGSHSVVGEHRHNIWTMAWADVARRYDDHDRDPRALEPGFISRTAQIRLLGDYAVPLSSGFEFDYFRVLREWLYRTYLAGAAQTWEFGCGSGFNLLALSRLFPQMPLVGLDWSQPAVDLINRVAADQGVPLRGQCFDFFNPDPAVSLPAATAVTTFCALEQTGDRCPVFLDWLLAQKPKVVVSMEPVVDFYDPTSLVDELAIRYHRGRGYLQGYLSWMQERESRGEITILKARRLGMGSLFHEGYSLLIWAPTA